MPATDFFLKICDYVYNGTLVKFSLDLDNSWNQNMIQMTQIIVGSYNNQLEHPIHISFKNRFDMTMFVADARIICIVLI